MRRALALWLVLLAAYAATLGVHQQPGLRVSARETHELLTAESIVSDGDVDLRDEYRAGDWKRFGGPAVKPTAGLVHGRLVESQGAGFPLLIAPAYAIGGRTAVRLWLAAIVALGFVAAAALARRLVPDPWATGAALVAGLSPPVVAAATSISPEGVGGTALAAAALGALAVREHPATKRLAFASAAAIAIAPWLAVSLVPAAAVCAVVLARWLRRRQRALAALVALEVILTSGVIFVTIHDRLYGGLTPYASSLAAHAATGAASLGDHLSRAPRLVGVFLDRDAGLLRWSPFAALALVAVWLLWRSRRDRLAMAVSEQIDVEVAGGFLVAVCATQVAAAAFLAPSLHGPWAPARLLLPAVPVGTALAALALRHAPRIGGALAAITLAGTMWLLAGPRIGYATLAPPRGDVPWGGAQDVLPVFSGTVGTGEAIAIAIVVAGLVALVVSEWRGWGSSRRPPPLGAPQL